MNAPYSSLIFSSSQPVKDFSAPALIPFVPLTPFMPSKQNRACALHTSKSSHSPPLFIQSF